MTSELARAALVTLLFLAVFGMAEAWRRLGDPPVEWTRKLVHFGGGLIAATFPWIFESRWVVLVLTGTMLALLWLTRRVGVLGSIHGVARRSSGELYYPIAVCLIYLIGRDRPVFYLIAVLALVVSDALAAVLGATYGRTIYDVERDRRSIEGSTVFFLSTFLVAHLPLLLLARIEPAASVLIALQISLIVSLFEGISLEGSDNLLVPLITYYLLIKMTPRSAAFIGEQLVAQLLIILIVALIAWRFRFIRASGAMAAALFFYGAYALGGPEWTVAPGIALLGVLSVRAYLRHVGREPKAEYQVLAMFYVSIVAVLLYALNNSFETLWQVPGALRLGDPLYAPFVGVVAAQLALMLGNQVEPFRRADGSPRQTGTEAALAVVAFLLVAPVGLMLAGEGLSAWTLLVAAAIHAGGSALYWIGRRAEWWPSEPPWNVRLQAAAVALAAVLVVPVHLHHLGAW
ncbi:MAG TPA: hypothetical protein VMN78_02170 [Longimicrobiales bacterium]|nr:hypothetical protein [Longimicrobiales bacterium]